MTTLECRYHIAGDMPMSKDMVNSKCNALRSWERMMMEEEQQQKERYSFSPPRSTARDINFSRGTRLGQHATFTSCRSLDKQCKASSLVLIF